MTFDEIRLKRSLGTLCAVCQGDENCPINKGVGTDMHEVFVTRGMVSRRMLPHLRERWNVALVCNQVNTGAVPYPDWKELVRVAKLKELGAGDLDAGARAVMEMIESLGLRSAVIISRGGKP